MNQEAKEKETTKSNGMNVERVDGVTQDIGENMAKIEKVIV